MMQEWFWELVLNEPDEITFVPKHTCIPYVMRWILCGEVLKSTISRLTNFIEISSLFRQVFFMDMVFASDMLFKPSSHPNYIFSSVVQAPIVVASEMAYRSRGIDIESKRASKQ